MKGVILAGGSGTRLRPATLVTGKQLLPVFDKPMIYYPLSTLIHAGCNEILLISTPNEIPKFQELLKKGNHFGLKIQYLVQDSPLGIAQGLKLAENFIAGEDFWFILGDNLFHGPDFGLKLKNLEYHNGAILFAYHVNNPESYGVAVFNETLSKVTDLVEKPTKFISNWAIPGLYRLDATCFEKFSSITPSARGEYEILDILKKYLEDGQLNTQRISRGNSWFDLGTPKNLLNAAEFVNIIQGRQGLLVGSPEEAAYNSNLITKEFMTQYLLELGNSDYSNQILESLNH